MRDKIVEKLDLVSSHQCVWKTYDRLHNNSAEVNEDHLTGELIAFLNETLKIRGVKSHFVGESKVNEGGRWSQVKKCYTTLPTGRDIYISFRTKAGKMALVSLQAKRIPYDSDVYVCSARDEDQSRLLRTHTHTIAKLIERYDITLTSHLFYSCLENERGCYTSALTAACSKMVKAQHEFKVDDPGSGCALLPKIYNKPSLLLPILNQYGFFSIFGDPLKNLFKYLEANFDVNHYEKNDKEIFRVENLLLAVEDLKQRYSENDGGFVFLHLENSK